MEETNMGQYDDIDPDVLRADLKHFAGLILQLDQDGKLLDATPRILGVLGDLRAKLFAYEVRATGRLLPRPETEDIVEARKIVEDAIARLREAEAEWIRPWTPESPHD